LFSRPGMIERGSFSGVWPRWLEFMEGLSREIWDKDFDAMGFADASSGVDGWMRG
jgi:hypothetical protein